VLDVKEDGAVPNPLTKLRTALVSGLCGSAILLAALPAAAAPPPDPLRSPMWEYRIAEWLGEDAVVRHDPRLRVVMPGIAEDQRAFPVLVDGRDIPGIRRILILVDLNPIPVPVDLELADAEPWVAIRIKLDQRTPVRALAQLADGSWVAAGDWIDAAGGGCSLPPVSRARGDWAEGLGRARARAWVEEDGTARLRVHMRHPMDTGFIENVPLYHLEEFAVRGADGRLLGRAKLWASVAEDPVLTLLPHARPGETLAVSATDSSGIRYAAEARVHGQAHASLSVPRPGSSATGSPSGQ
jgi:sulfur-oxidizing protein SoxY